MEIPRPVFEGGRSIIIYESLLLCRLNIINTRLQISLLFVCLKLAQTIGKQALSFLAGEGASEGLKFGRSTNVKE